MKATSIQLRPATSEDFEFLWRLQCEAMRPNVEMQFGPWDERFQRALFEENTRIAEQQIIECDGIAVGGQCVQSKSDSVELIRLQLLPSHQRLGIGSTLVKELVETAHASGREAKLQVFPTSPARELYRRLGFRTVEISDTHETMVCPAPEASIEVR